MSAPNAVLRFRPVRLETGVRGSEVVILDTEPNGTQKLELLRLNAAAARRLGRELIAGADQVERGEV